MSLLPQPASYLRPRPLSFGVNWHSPWKEFRSSLYVFFAGPGSPKVGEFSGGPYLTIYWVRSRLPGRAFVASSLWHVAAILIALLPIWGFLPSTKPNLAPLRIELTWYGAPQDLPPIALHGPAAKLSPIRHRLHARRGADALHPRQTILSMPLHVTHPRQTLIQPNAPAAPPKIVSQLPNMVEWAATSPQPKPQLQFSPTVSAPRVQRRAVRDVAAPEVANLERNLGPLNIASSPVVNQQPQMPMAPMSAPVAQRQKTYAVEAAAPEIGPAALPGDSSLHRLIAISTAPAPPAPEVSVPEGNLSARILISPEGAQPGVQGGPEHGPATSDGGANGNGVSLGGARGAGGNGGSGNANSLPGGVSISGGSNGHSGGGGGIAPAGTRTGGKLILKPMTTLPTRPEPGSSSHRTTPLVVGNLSKSLPPEKILWDKQVYTLFVNMPNLTSNSGSWVLNFAQLDEEDSPPYKKKPELSGPVPLSKVDPKYPPSLIEARVDGEVILYAIIRKDGSVDSIQLVRGLDPQLDLNSMEALARWKFRPATRQGEPVELETVVHIPFHLRSANPY